MRRLLGLLLPLALVACAGEPEQNMAQSVGQDSVAMALASYSPSLFDSITWKADTAQTNRGAVVWMFSCRKCHGDTGHGDGGWVMDGDTLQPPPFDTVNWRFAEDRVELIKYIYAGNAGGMPHWGVVGLKPRDIDAVAAYIQKLLVPPPEPQS
ncbi:MAG TPA: c-type cytochrome [Longimicrobiales bacterium]|nr:c-type cytochrome [Longimicrobiales bacterium]